ncbi:hypothetical protein OU995_03790 [Roseateles sp. SL47]|uniref:hypothetical protein n=1 Tax=Roseateles sp. SL47 TaxID=2995138 RepID=UPI00226EE779|nr:hypothetical protein [Roseateles sp. SL47]WAC73868.1 hypothetical protein OU995_03790 [Roseateles sp. SL47]
MDDEASKVPEMEPAPAPKYIVTELSQTELAEIAGGPQIINDGLLPPPPAVANFA